jgi:DNA-binding GntR family transcriptional regulator
MFLSLRSHSYNAHRPMDALVRTIPDKSETFEKSRAEHGMSLSTAFYEIRDLIVHGKLSPGTWIVETDLAEHLGMSRTPVRSAIQWLQREGYILEHKSASKSRMIVAPLTKEDASELYPIVGRIEGLAGRQVAALPVEKRTEIVGKLESLNKQLLRIVRTNDGRSGIFELDAAFHRTIVEAGAGPRLKTLHKTVEPQTERYWRLYASSIMQDLHLSIAEHDDIIEAIQNGDADRIERTLQINWENGLLRLAVVIEMFGERGSF